jgi:protein involved in polysaccharide export with SLBB domain
MPVHVWGEVNSPGIHYLPVGASLSLAVSAAGGPQADASLPDVSLTRAGDSREINLYELGPKTALQQNDSIVIKTSAKKDLPLIFSTISTVISIITLTVILRRN